MQEDQAPPQGGGGDPLQALAKFNEQLAKITQVVTQNPQVPDEAKAAFTSSLEAFRAGLEILSGGGGEGPEGPAAVAPEAGGNAGAVPASPAGVRR